MSTVDPRLTSSSVSWWGMSIESVAHKLRVKLGHGLRNNEVKERIVRYGTNTLAEERVIHEITRFFNQLKNPLAVILLIAGAFSFGLGEYVNGLVIGVALLVNAIIGMLQEGRADKAFHTLKNSIGSHSTVLREGKKLVVPSEDIVPGDVLCLESGASIPADARLISTAGFTVNESSLTGEWVEVEKNSLILSPSSGLAERKNMVYAGTIAVSGAADALVVSTGTHTEFARIASALEGERDRSTPLQEHIRSLSRTLGITVLAILLAIFILGIYKGQSAQAMIIIAVAMAVAAIPEGLPAAVTVALALGMEAVLKRNGLVRNLLAAETLGQTTVILTDKTGTLTKGEMRVAEIISYTSLVKNTAGGSLHGTAPHLRLPDEEDVLTMAMLASDAFVEHEGEAMSDWVVRGRPIEQAIVRSGLESGILPRELFLDFPRVDFIPFSAKSRFAASLHSVKKNNSHFVYFSGAPEELLIRAEEIHVSGRQVEKTKEIVEHIMQAEARCTKSGMRVLGVAYKVFGKNNSFSSEERIDPTILTATKLVFVGFIAFHDPLRADVKESISLMKHAGGKVIMVTGDHAETALAIAKEAGIATQTHSDFVLGSELAKLDDLELAKRILHVRVFARMLPEHKLRLLRVLQAKGEIVAMTGDGVNDAPALRGANIGVALGSGTDVAKEAADIVLLDNSFTTIVSAIEEGRRVLDNLKKIVGFLLSTSFSEIILVAGSLLFGFPMPFLAVQILWINMATEGLMNFAFAFEQKEDGIMLRNPRDLSMRLLLTPKLKILIFSITIGNGILLFWYYASLLVGGYGTEVVYTMIFLALSGLAFSIAFSFKNFHRPLWAKHIFTNRYLWFAFGLSLLSVCAALFFAPLRDLLHLAPLSVQMPWGLLVLLLGGNLILVETMKYFLFMRHKSEG